MLNKHISTPLIYRLSDFTKHLFLNNNISSGIKAGTAPTCFRGIWVIK
jgi:hypothetical protein